jgi:Ni,Fe-hydrogenase III large subunit
MNASVRVHRVDRHAVPTLEASAWRDDLVQQLHAGMRAVTLFGRRVDERVLITAVLQATDQSLRLSRTVLAAEHGYHELTSQWPALHCFERELHEQTGVQIRAHPWLKPIRYEGQQQSAMAAHRFYEMEGKGVHEVAVGPIHAGVIEPGSFRFACFGEQVQHLEIQLGYQHRGVERRLLEGDPRRLTPLVETIAGDTSVAHAWAYCAAIESLVGCKLGIDTEIARAVALELERVAMHLSGLAGMAADIGFQQGAATYGRLRTTAINTTMRLCGSRFGRSALRPGTHGMQLTADLYRDISANIELLRRDLAIIDDCFFSARTVQHRLRGVGVLTQADATELGIVGPAARASGVAIDARQEMHQGAYKLFPIPRSLANEGDCWARAQLRKQELDASLAWLASVLERYPNWEREQKPIAALMPAQLVVTLVEGWRGEIVHCLETGDAGELVHYKVQDPSLRNWMALAIAMRKNEISDFPICNKSFDLSYCGNDL